jgi:hypothetical protein
VIVLLALFILLVSLPATIVLVALTVVGSALAATAEGTIVAPELGVAPVTTGGADARPDASAA